LQRKSPDLFPEHKNKAGSVAAPGVFDQGIEDFS